MQRIVSWPVRAVVICQILQYNWKILVRVSPLLLQLSTMSSHKKFGERNHFTLKEAQENLYYKLIPSLVAVDTAVLSIHSNICCHASVPLPSFRPDSSTKAPSTLTVFCQAWHHLNTLHPVKASTLAFFNIRIKIYTPAKTGKAYSQNVRREPTSWSD